MKKIFILLTIITQFTTLSFAALNIKTSVAIKAEKAPIVDGIIGEEWDKAFWQDSFVAFPGDIPTRQQSKFAVMFSATDIYIAVLCDEIHKDKIKSFSKNEIDVWRYDGLEIFIQSKNSANNYKQFMLSVGGGVYSIDLNNVSVLKRTRFPESKWESKTVTTDSGYATEIKIPFSVFDSDTPGNGDEWRFNILRNATTIDSDRYSTWTPMSKIHKPAEFGYIIFAVTEPELIRQRYMALRKFNQASLALQQFKKRYIKTDPEFIKIINAKLQRKNWPDIKRQSAGIMNMNLESLSKFNNSIKELSHLPEELEELRSEELLDSFF